MEHPIIYYSYAFVTLKYYKGHNIYAQTLSTGIKRHPVPVLIRIESESKAIWTRQEGTKRGRAVD